MTNEKKYRNVIQRSRREKETYENEQRKGDKGNKIKEK